MITKDDDWAIVSMESRDLTTKDEDIKLLLEQNEVI